MDDQHAIRVRDEDLTGEDGIARAVTDRCHAGLHVQLTAVIGGFLDTVEGEQQIAQGLIGLLGRGNTPEVPVGHLLGLLELPREDQVADLREVLDRFGVVVVVRAAGPERALIQRDPLVLDAAEDHRPHDAVAERHRLQPSCGRLAVPQHHGLLRAARVLPGGIRRRGGKLPRATKAAQKRAKLSRPSVRFSYDAPFVSQRGVRMHVLALLRDEMASRINYICLGFKRRRESRSDTLASGAIGAGSLPAKQAKKLPRHPVPVVLLARLAVDRNTHGKGLGAFLLRDALTRSLDLAEKVGIRAVVVDALDAEAKSFYQHFGFLPLTDDAMRLFLPLSTLRSAAKA